MPLNGSTLNHSGSITPHSLACCSLRHLGLGLGWQTFCSSPMEKIVMPLNGSTLNHSGSITPHSLACCSLRHLGLGLGWQTFSSSPMEKISFFTYVESWYRIIISLFILGFSCIIIPYLIACMTSSSKIRGKYRKTASAIWTRRRVYWRKRRLSRSEYLVEMKSRQTTPTGVAISFENIPTTAPSHTTLNDNVQGQTMNSRPLATKKSCEGGKTGKSSLDYGRGRKSCTFGKIRIRSSHDCRRAPSKQLAFFDTPKRIKRRLGFRR